MKVTLLTREYPPEVYGGAGVHVTYLARELARRVPVEVRCFGSVPEPAPPEPAPGAPSVRSFVPSAGSFGQPDLPPVLQVLAVDVSMAAGLEQASLVHSHTWYANLAGHFGKLLHDIPHVMTSHSLEPRRAWKAEQLGRGGYALSSFCERTAIAAADAVIAVSKAMARDVLACYPSVDPGRVEVIHNGVDVEEYRPDPASDVLDRYGIEPGRPLVLFVGRIVRQKGITNLLDAALHIDASAQLVLCAASPDTEEIARETAEKVELVRARRGGVVWINEMIPAPRLIQLLSHAAVFCCPSIYEPLGIVNLEAAACETAVVATATGGIPEVVLDGETGLLVPLELAGDGQAPLDPERFALDIAERVNLLVADPALAARMGKAGRRRMIEHFSWGKVAEKTLALYRRLVAG
ncbi:MAG: glycogen synthase [Actinomycetota bacterium]